MRERLQIQGSHYSEVTGATSFFDAGELVEGIGYYNVEEGPFNVPYISHYLILKDIFLFEQGPYRCFLRDGQPAMDERGYK